MNVNVHIERLVLDGLNVRPDQRLALQSAMESELGRLLTTGGLANGITNVGVIPRVVGHAIQLPQQTEPQDTGRRIATSVYGAIGAQQER